MDTTETERTPTEAETTPDNPADAGQATEASSVAPQGTADFHTQAVFVGNLDLEDKAPDGDVEAEEPTAEAAPEAAAEAAPEAAAETNSETEVAPEPVVKASTEPPRAVAVPEPPAPLSGAYEVMNRLRARMRSQVLGRDEVIDLVLVALLADGHVLLEDFPGSGKTTLAKALGGSIIADDPRDDIQDFRRIQFTPDLLPSDVTGVSVFDAASGSFHFRRGPIFAHVLLADEINRTSPKVQSAMLEAMAEKQVTVDNVTHALDDLFFVIATQNPLDLAGTYPLPVAQLDRFLFKIRMTHIDRDSELEVLDTWRSRRDVERVDLPRVTRTQVLEARRALDEHVAIGPEIRECLVDIAQAVRTDDRVLQGNSTRSLVLLLPALQAHAVLRGRDYVASEDILALIPRVLGHRVELAPGVGELDEALAEILEQPLENLARATLKRRSG